MNSTYNKLVFVGDDNMSKLKLDKISINYHSLKGETEALQDISFKIDEGEFVSIVGPSGCGKSTLLNIIVGLLKPSYGEVYLDDTLLDSVSLKIGYMFQNDTLFEWLSVFDNVSLGLKINHKYNEKNIAKINFLLKEYNIEEFKNHHPRELSGGMRQRVALIRTLVMDPEILLLDEPFSALDYQTRLNVSGDILNIIKKENKTALLVTHDISEAIAMSERVIILTKRPAYVKKEIKIQFPEEYDTPLKRREHPSFREYFDIIWKELDVNDDGK
jgi:NitT/TauT family transport system ATP-binding protein